MEKWRPVLGFEAHYEVSDEGRARRTSAAKNTHPGRMLKPLVLHTGYLRFIFCVDRSRKYASAHRTVWEAFVSPIPADLQINHKNGVKTDNRLANLDCVTQSENVKWNFRVLGVKPPNNPNPGEKNGRAKLSAADIPRVFALRAKGLSQQAIADTLGIHQTNISRVLLGQTWKKTERNQ